MSRLCFIALALASFPSLARAQVWVNEEDFLAVLNDDHPARMALSERVGIARAERVRAGLLPNPTATFEREAPGNGAEQIIWQLAWTPPLDGRRGPAVRAGAAGLAAATHQLEAERLELRSRLREAFADWAFSTERKATIEAHGVLIRRLAGQMRARATSGEESGLSASRLELAAVEVAAEAARTFADEVRAGAAALAWHRGLAAEAVPQRPPLPVLSDTVRTPLRADLLARRFEVEQAQWQLRAGGRFLKFPELAFGWQQIREENATLEGPRVGVSWPVPLFDRRQPERIEASARLAAARGRLEFAGARAAGELTASRAAYLRLREAALEAMKTTDRSERVVESATTTFRLGESRLTDLLETLRSVLAARLAALDLYAAALEAHRSLELAAGRSLTEVGGFR